MGIFFISYHSNIFKKNIELENKIKLVSSNFIEVFPNTWFIVSTSIGHDLQKIFSTFITDDEQLLITETTGDVSCIGINNNTIDFLNSYC
ncbi:hypothetical protein [Chryseobacterium sp. Leaf394]|jgi:hypothetical protein|uniref:hypothetical protein n=1 Tax=Chryseobacterium sp. Leaf394 TaxID=1736361 RepID=UPI0006F68AF2|nr:hypothetical protein [Chryseobacterium sp. Leaf394]KQS91507.1 hypothetical protein ASG21_03285 [Chryseobacterium sp. Leaf394]